MRKWVSKIIVPAVLVAAAAVQSFGIDSGRAIRWNHYENPDSTSLKDIVRDSVKPVIDTLSSAVDSIEKARLDSIRIRLDSIFIDSLRAKIDSFGYDYFDSAELAKLDSLEKLYAEPVFNPADTVRIPDSLEFTDPFKFKYYVAIKDTATLHHMRDSLLAIPDSAELAKLDSLYFKDSTEVAQWRFNTWYKGLTKKERKKYDYEQALPAKIHKMDSILNRKDSIKAYKDSVKEATPRILDTYILPDSLQYKRILMWTHVPRINEIKLQKIDTSYNAHFYDYPFYQEDAEVTYLGVVGSAVQNNNYFKRRNEENVFFYTPYQVYSYTPSDLPQFNTKTPYTELCYWGTLLTAQTKEESSIRVRTSQNITPSLNLLLEYHRFGGKGLLKNEATDNRTAVVGLNYAGKKYLMHGGYIYNKVGRTENGGAIDQDGDFNWIRDTLVKDVREIEVNLSKASSLMKKHTFFLDQSYRIPFSALAGAKERKKEKIYKDSLMTYGDSTEIEEYLAWEEEVKASASLADTVYKDVTSAYFGHSSELSMFRRTYDDEISSGNTFYKNYYYNPTRTADSLRVMRFDNRLYMRMQPWKADGIVSHIDAGIGDKLLTYFDFNDKSYLGAKSTVVCNSVYAYAGVQGQFRKYLHWDADGEYTFLGHELNDFGVNANVELNFYPFRRYKKEPLTFDAHFETSLKEPDYYEEHIHTNHFKWDNDFKKKSVTKVEAGLHIPKWRFDAEFGYALLANTIYYDTLAIIRQSEPAMSVFTGSVRKDFAIWKIHLDNRAVIQYSTNPEVMPLPLVSLNLRYYFQFDVVKNVMQAQIGANAWFTTKWYSPAYNPALGVFHNQNEVKYGNCPYVDVFANFQWKKACIFVKYVNANMGWPCDDRDYFSAHHYIKPTRAVKFGIYWPFYVAPGSGHSHESGSKSSGGARSGGSRSGGSRSAGGSSARSMMSSLGR